MGSCSVSIAHGLPNKILKTAQERGIHNDCVAAGADKMCVDCWCIVTLSLDEHYAHLGVQGALAAFTEDLLAEA